MAANSYAQTQDKYFLDSEGLTYLARMMNQYPTNTVIAAVVDGVQDALEDIEKSSLHIDSNGRLYIIDDSN